MCSSCKPQRVSESKSHPLAQRECVILRMHDRATTIITAYCVIVHGSTDLKLSLSSGDGGLFGRVLAMYDDIAGWVG